MQSVSVECMQGDSAGSNPRLCLENKIGEMKIHNIPIIFSLGHQGGRRCHNTLQ